MTQAQATTLLGAALGVAVAGAATAGTVTVNSDIDVSTTWTSDNTYRMTDQIFVRDGATLTIQAGTVVASPLGGSLAVARGSKIIVQGTKSEPVIMTSDSDDFVTWRRAANEWGNLTLMGRAYTSGCDVAMPTCDAANTQPMEGLVGDPQDPGLTRYGGGDDDDNSGSIHYLSIRYGGKVIALGDELNGLSLGGIGRDTDIDHVEIMNNVDDGTEIWGGTVNLRYISIWNVGDDSFDVDQGWRGKAQFGCIVQGFSVNANQGSGVGDNCLETDGAEEADWQPVTTAKIYNFTVIGQPADGDYATAWRDNAHLQYRNCVFVTSGDDFVKLDGGDNCTLNQGYGYMCTLSWEDTWTTDYSYSFNQGCNDCGNPMDRYQAQTDGKLAEITDSVTWGFTKPTAFVEATARGVFAPANNNVMIGGFDPADSPVTLIEFSEIGDPGYLVSVQGKTILNVKLLDPRGANEATTSVNSAPNDGFLVPAQYRGGFGPQENWLSHWTAADAYGFLVDAPCPYDIDGNGEVGFGDLLYVLANWGLPAGLGDLDCNGDVGFGDLLLVLSNYGPCP